MSHVDVTALCCSCICGQDVCRRMRPRYFPDAVLQWRKTRHSGLYLLLDKKENFEEWVAYIDRYIYIYLYLHVENGKTWILEGPCIWHSRYALTKLKASSDDVCSLDSYRWVCKTRWQFSFYKYVFPLAHLFAKTVIYLYMYIYIYVYFYFLRLILMRGSTTNQGVLDFCVGSTVLFSIREYNRLITLCVLQLWPFTSYKML